MEPAQPTEPETPTGGQPAKFSRYRSVRKATMNSKPAPPPLPPQPAPDVKRSMSRYRKARPTNAPATAPPVPTSFPPTAGKSLVSPEQGIQREQSASQTRNGSQTRGHRSNTMPKRSQTVPLPSQEEAKNDVQHQTKPRQRERKGTYRSVPDTHKSLAEDSDATGLFINEAQREAYAILNGEAGRQKKLRQEQMEREKERRIVLEEEERVRQDKIKAVERARLEEIKEQEIKKRAVEERTRQVALERERVKAAEKEATKARKQAEREEKEQLQASLKSPRRPRTPPDPGMQDYRDLSSAERAASTPSSKKRGIPGFKHRPEEETSTRKIVDDRPPQLSLGFDAPISAVNAGTRKVTVVHNEMESEVSVTPDSTPVDLLTAAARNLKANINPWMSILAESFKQVGLERPLRRYERIRDVMNSWDHDSQNVFVVLPADTGEGAALEAKDAPKEQPNEISVNIHYSNKPGSWDRRWITLRSDGQVLVSRQPGVDQKNICHMTDFDIYVPTAKRLKKIKPPKKYCFAMKSQQKSAMFLSAENFVHFVSTKDKDQAETWYSAVQSWRSWYLVHEMGLGNPEEDTSLPTSGTRQRSASVESKPYQLGSFKPFLSDDIFGSLLVDSVTSRPTEPRSTETRPTEPTQLTFINRGGPPSSFPKKITKDHQSNIIQSEKPVQVDPFSSTGLLGRTYSQRQRALQERNEQDSAPQTHLFPGQKPLVDLRLDYQEQPQQAGRGRGFVLGQVPSGGLVNMATGRDDPYSTSISPPAMNASLLCRSGTVRSSRTNARSSTGVGRPGRGDVPDMPSAFTGTGLLASAEEGVGAGRPGRGVASGNRGATEPLIDFSGERKYLPGSLLDSVERWEGSDGSRERVVVDRSKRKEGEVKVGEGF